MEVSGRKSQSTAIIEKVLWQILYFVSKLLTIEEFYIKRTLRKIILI